MSFEPCVVLLGCPRAAAAQMEEAIQTAVAARTEAELTADLLAVARRRVEELEVVRGVQGSVGLAVSPCRGRVMDTCIVLRVSGACHV